MKVIEDLKRFGVVWLIGFVVLSAIIQFQWHANPEVDEVERWLRDNSELVQSHGRIRSTSLFKQIDYAPGSSEAYRIYSFKVEFEDLKQTERLDVKVSATGIELLRQID